MMLAPARTQSHFNYEEEYSKVIESMNTTKIINGWCVQEVFTCFFNTLLQLKQQHQLPLLKQHYETLCKSIFLENQNQTYNYEMYVNLLYKLILYTRDINGLGRYTQSYMLVIELYKFGSKYEAQLAERAERSQVTKEHIQESAYLIIERFVKHYGSWKDVKYFLNYYVEELQKDKKKNDLGNDFLIHKIVKLICKHLKEEPSNTLIAKWLPREKSIKFGWIIPIIAREYYCEWFSETISTAQYKAATRKALTHFRQLLSNLNKELKTTQTYQCNNTWSQMDFNNVTKYTKQTLYKQENAFNGVNKQFKDENEPTIFNSWDTILQKLSKYAELNK